MHIKVIIQIIIVIIVNGLLVGCHYKDNRELVQRIRNMNISVPLDSMERLSPIRAGINLQQEVENPDYMYIIYYDSLTCAPCKLNRMSIWRSIIRNAKSINNKINFIFIFHPQNKVVEEFRHEYYRGKLQLQIYLDSIGIMERHNPLLTESPLFHTFIINKENHIEAIGDAGNDETVERKFYDFLRKSPNEQ